MFASSEVPRSAVNRRQSAGLYQQVGVESQLATASPHHLVTMLFDGFMEAIAQAKGAVRANDHAVKGLAIGRAVRIVEEGLRAGLDMRAGSLAQDLSELYSYVILRLTMANLRSSEAALDECQRLVQPLRDAWASIGPAASSTPARTASR